MAFRIASNIPSMSAGRYLGNAQRAVTKSLESLASGSRIVNPADDAAGYAISESLRGQISGTKQAENNAEAAIGMVQTAEGGLNEQSNILIRLRELAVNSSSDTISDNEREALDKEFQGLSQEFDRIAKSTRYGDREMLTGSGKSFDFQVGPFGGAADRVTFKLDADTTASNVGISGSGVSSKGDARGALEDIDSAIKAVANTRSSFGSMQSRLQHSSDALSLQNENLSAARSRIVDVDTAEESSNLARAQVQQEAGTSILAQANQMPGRALRLLG